MAAGNTVDLVGNTTRDAELKFLANGQAVANFGIAVNRRWQNKQTSEWEEAVSFFDIVAWGTLGENVAELPKGTRIMVSGRLEQQSWETDAGEKRSKVIVVADEVGPSLRWATAQITRNERPEGQATGNSGSSRVRNTPANTAPPASSGYDYEEEPF